MQKEESYLSILKENQKKQAESGGMKISSRNNRKKQPIKRGLPDPKPIKEEEEPLEDVPEIALPIEETKESEAVIEPEPADEIEKYTGLNLAALKPIAQALGKTLML